MPKPLVYFLCTGNSCRSQMADGFLNTLGGHLYEVKSAGLEAHGMNPRAVKIMAEAGIDISSNSSNVIDTETLNRASYVITLCGHADEHCPVISNSNVMKWHWGLFHFGIRTKDMTDSCKLAWSEQAASKLNRRANGNFDCLPHKRRPLIPNNQIN